MVIARSRVAIMTLIYWFCGLNGSCGERNFGFLHISPYGSQPKPSTERAVRQD